MHTRSSAHRKESTKAVIAPTSSALTARSFGVQPGFEEPPRAVQAKLTIGAPGDSYEQEADQVAKQVVETINAPVQPQLQRQSLPEEEELRMEPQINLQRQPMPEEEVQMKPLIQRKSAAGTAASSELENSIQAARGSGQPLAHSIREPMEQAFAADFSNVKIHTDAQSNQLNRSIQAKAFTTGQDVFFKEGEYNPSSRSGQELLAHELTHVVQQEKAVRPSALNAQTVLSQAEPALTVQRFLDSRSGKKDFEADPEGYIDQKFGAYIKKKPKNRSKLAEKAIAKLRLAHREDLIDYIYENFPQCFGESMGLLGGTTRSDEIEAPGAEAEEPHKQESGDYYAELEDYLEKLNSLKQELESWKRDKTYEEYTTQNFISILKEKAETLKKSGDAIKTFVGAKVASSITNSGDEVAVLVEALAGVQEEATVEFNFINKYGNFNAQLQQSFQAGAWGRGEASAKLSRTGVSLAAGVYAAIGGELSVKGAVDLNGVGGIGLSASGRGTIFAGAQGGASLALSADVREGIEASIKAGAFAGAKAELEGNASFKLRGREIFTTGVTAGVSFGAGGELEAMFKAGIFGDTSFGLKASAAVGLGASAGATFNTNFSNLGLATAESLLELRNISTLAKGYSPDLTFQDRENLLRLEQLLKSVDKGIASTEEEIQDYDDTPEEERPLLV